MNKVEATDKTSLIGIIGFPLVSSLSPVFQNEALNFLGLEYVYLPFSIKPPLLKDAILGLKALGSRGFNVTTPFKVTCMPFLDALSYEARECGAVNTVVKRGNKFVGYNTDGKGFLRSLDEMNFLLEGKRVTVMGGGGAARAICFSILRRKAAALTIFTRKPDAARKWMPKKRIVTAVSYGDRRVSSFLSESDVLVNTTTVGTVGTTPYSDRALSPFSLVDLRLLRRGVLVYDINCYPTETKLLKKASELGLETMNGLSMLLWQGVFSFELWTGRRAPVEKMRDALISALEKVSM